MEPITTYYPSAAVCVVKTTLQLWVTECSTQYCAYATQLQMWTEYYTMTTSASDLYKMYLNLKTYYTYRFTYSKILL